MFCIFPQDLWAGLIFKFVFQYSEYAMENVNLVPLWGPQNQLELCIKEFFCIWEITSIACWTVLHCQKSYSENARDALKYRHTLLVSLLSLLFWSLVVSTPYDVLKRPLSLNWASVWNLIFWDKGRPLSVKANKICGLSMCMHILMQCLDFSSAMDAFHFEIFAVCQMWLIFLLVLQGRHWRGLAVYYVVHHSWVIILYYILGCDVGKISGYIM